VLKGFLEIFREVLEISIVFNMPGVESAGEYTQFNIILKIFQEEIINPEYTGVLAAQVGVDIDEVGILRFCNHFKNGSRIPKAPKNRRFMLKKAVKL
jgi:hypothetical protein